MAKRTLLTKLLLALGLAFLAGAHPQAASAATARRATTGGGRPQPETSAQAQVQEQVMLGQAVRLTGSAFVNFSDLARREAELRARGFVPPPVRVLVHEEEEEEGNETPPEPYTGPPALEPLNAISPLLNVFSPSPTTSFMGLDDIPMADSSYIIIPPDIGGAVGPTKVMCTFNNNYRIQDKVTGATLSTVGTATFWDPVVTNKALLSQLTDPRTTYDPVNNRWIVCMQTINNPGLILFGVSQTSDPSSGWYLYSVSPGFTSAPRLDYPILGFNKNWIAITINAYTSGGAFSRGGCMIASYPQARAGTLSGVTNISQSSGTHFCTAPCVTISATQDTLFLVTHLSSGSATLAVDRITGTATPTYTVGATYTRPGGGWVEPSGNLLPQSAPNSGVSACSPPCTIETSGSFVRSAPTYRVDATSGCGYIYYTQTVGLPSSGLTHTGIQWTKLTAGISASSPTSANAQFANGGRIEDATATATNGGKWYSNPHIAVNSLGDVLVGYSQFSSAQHPAAGYSYRDHTDPAGTMRDPLVYKAGDDYYHKDFGGGRNRWGDFSTAQVDPTDDQTLWVLQEYAKNRTSTDDGATGANGSKWSSYWAAVTPASGPLTMTASAGPGGSISPGGAVAVTRGTSQTFTIAANACYAIADVIVDGVSQGAIASYTFPNVQANHVISASFTALGPYTIAASADAGGSISPPGNVSVACGASQGFTITPDPCHHIADVLVDGGSVGAVAAWTFPNVQGGHTISASFALDTFTITATAGAGGAISPAGATTVNCGADQAYTITPDTGYYLTSLLVDGAPVALAPGYTFPNVQAGHNIEAGFSLDQGTIAAGSSAATLGPNHPCDVIPVTLARPGGTPVLRYSVTFQLSPELTLCSGLSSISEGDFLSGSGPTAFSVTDNGGGSYTVSDGLTSGCGPTATTGSLFSIEVGSTSPTGPGTITLTALDLRDCASAALPATSGPPASIAIDNLAPEVAVTSPNGSEALDIGASFPITWTASDAAGIDHVLLLLSRTGAGGTFDTLATGLANSPPHDWTVTGPTTSDAYLRVVALDALGNAGSDLSDAAFSIGSATGVDGGVPVAFALLPVMPNPGRGSATIRYALPRAASVRLTIVDLQGREVAVLSNGTKDAGAYQAKWNGMTVTGRAGAGVYFVRFQTPERTFARRFVFVH